MLASIWIVTQLFSHIRGTHVGSVSKSMRWRSYRVRGWGHVRDAAQPRPMLPLPHTAPPMSLENSLLLSVFGWWVTWLFSFSIFLSESFKPFIMNYLNYSFHFSHECSGKPSSSCILFTQHHFHLIVQKRLLELFSGAFWNWTKPFF